MNSPTIPGFEYRIVATDAGVDINVAVAGDGPALVLLHGFPQTLHMWHRVAPQLTDQHTVIAIDLRGYGASSKPPADSPDTYSKRTMGRDVVTVAGVLGHDRFGVVGHDRGALVGVRTALDHPDAVSYLGVLDVLPTLDTWSVLHGVDAKVAWHMYLMAQPPGLPEKMIAAVAPEFFASFLDVWDPAGATFTPEIREHYITSSVSAVDAIVAEYRASATVDLAMDEAARADGAQLRMPVGVIAQDWGDRLGFDAADLWRRWAPDLTYEPIDAGHFMAEERPTVIAEFIAGLAARSVPPATG